MLVPVRSIEYTRNLETVRVVVAHVEPKETSRLIQSLPELAKLKHLKRVRKSNERNMIIIAEDGANLPQINGLETSIVSVSKHAPMTTEQYHEWNALWPLNLKVQ